MDKFKILTISVVVLALMNFATLGFMWSKSHNKHKHRSEKMCCADKKQGQCEMHKKGHKEGKKCEQQCDRKGGPDKGRDQKKKMSGELIGKRLHFSEEQQAQLKKTSETHFVQIKEFHEKKKALKKELIGLLKDEANEEKKANLITQSTELEKEILLHKMNHFSTIKGICTPEQTEEFYKLIEEMGNRMHGKKKKG